MASPPPQDETFQQKLVRKFSAEPLIPVGAAVTVGCLTMGLRAFHGGNQLEAQKLMRGRIVAQGFTVVVMLMGAYAGFKPHDRPTTYGEKMQRQLDANIGKPGTN
jgi:hypothetical protein